MKGKNSKLKANFADKFLRDMNLSKLKNIESARVYEIEKRILEEESDDSKEKLQKKFELFKFM